MTSQIKPGLYVSGARAKAADLVTNFTAAKGEIEALQGQQASDSGRLNNLESGLLAKADNGHVHTIAQVTGLQSALDGKAASSHAHTIANITGLQAALDALQAQIEASVPTESFVIPISDRATNLVAASNVMSFRMPYAFTLTTVRSSLETAATGSSFIIDINVGGVSILNTKLSIDATERTSKTAASAVAISNSTIAEDAIVSFDIDQIGSTIAGKGAIVTLIGQRTL